MAFRLENLSHLILGESMTRPGTYRYEDLLLPQSTEQAFIAATTRNWRPDSGIKYQGWDHGHRRRKAGLIMRWNYTNRNARVKLSSKSPNFAPDLL